MKAEVELPKSMMKFYAVYSKVFGQSLDETLRQVLSDFAFGAIELGFQGRPTESERPTK